MSGVIKVRVTIFGAAGWSESEALVREAEVLLAPNRHDALCGMTIPVIENAVSSFLSASSMSPSGIVRGGNA